MFPCLLACGICASVEQTIGVGYAVLTFSALYIIGFAVSWGPVLWVIIPEIFPFRFRGKSVGASAMSHWLFTTIIGALFPEASSASLAACFFFFGGAILIGVVIIYLFQIETAGKTADEIDEAYANHVPSLKRKDW